MSRTKPKTLPVAALQSGPKKGKVLKASASAAPAVQPLVLDREDGYKHGGDWDMSKSYLERLLNTEDQAFRMLRDRLFGQMGVAVLREALQFWCNEKYDTLRIYMQDEVRDWKIQYVGPDAPVITIGIDHLLDPHLYQE